MNEDRPLLDTMMEMTESSLKHSNLDDRLVMMVRFAALAAVDAPPASYLVNMAMAADLGLTLEDAQSVLIAITPIIGTPKAVAAVGAIMKAFGIAIELGDQMEMAKA
jgi:alkylhydroperoxidase/carboxymuconolactone decarboxylase family protein YurZ